MKVHDKDGVTLYHSHGIFALMSMPSDSVDAIVTDPPYGISFMGKKWDYDVPSVYLWREALRVLKPGGHLLSFAGSRTYHRMACNIEDAGFEIRDQIMWIYGSGFPKSLDISKAIDEAAGAEREVGKPKADVTGRFRALEPSKGHSNGFSGQLNVSRLEQMPVTPEAKQWDGWGTGLKPAHEPIVVARKPLIGKVIENVLEHGTGGININGGRIEAGKEILQGSTVRDNIKGGNYASGHKQNDGTIPNYVQNPKGRFPSNVILDPEAAELLDKQSGILKSGDILPHHITHESENKAMSGKNYERTGQLSLGDSGGASRFFYCAKASKLDRDEGLELMKLQEAGIKNDSGRGYSESDPYAKIMRRNVHPTVKPTALMQYLVRLVTPPGGTILDPFMGSGSTGKAAVCEGFKFIGIEREAEYIPIAKARINAPAQVTLL